MRCRDQTLISELLRSKKGIQAVLQVTTKVPLQHNCGEKKLLKIEKLPFSCQTKLVKYHSVSIFPTAGQNILVTFWIIMDLCCQSGITKPIMCIWSIKSCVFNISKRRTFSTPVHQKRTVSLCSIPLRNIASMFPSSRFIRFMVCSHLWHFAF